MLNLVRARSASKRQRMERDARRRQLLRCAVEVFAQRGLGRAGHADVARLAGVAVPTVFSYFPTREDLVDAVIEEVHGFYETIGKTADRQLGSLEDRLIAQAQAFADSVDTHRDHARILLDWSSAVASDTWQRYMTLVEERLQNVRYMIEIAQQTGEVPSEVDAEDAARLFISQGHMLVFMKFAYRDAEAIHRYLVHLVRSALSVPCRATAVAG